MLLLSLIFKNIIARPTRTLLTMLGISVGIAAIVALNTIGSGMNASMSEIISAGGSDFIVGQAHTIDMWSSTISGNQVNEIKSMEGVKNAVGLYIRAIDYNKQIFLLSGINRADFDVIDINIIKGEAFEDGSETDLIIGKIAASSYNLDIGNQLLLMNTLFTVKGIYETGVVMQDAGAFASLKTIQNIAGSGNIVTMLFVQIKPEADPALIAANIDEKYKDQLVTIKSINDVAKVTQGMELMNSMRWAISFLAILTGAVVVLNTMIMAVSERIKEIGVLRAVGWRKTRIIRMIMGESFILGVGGFIIGALLGVVIVYMLAQIPVLGSFIRTSFHVSHFLIAFLIALVLAMLGGLYPTFRACRILPTEALRHE